MPPLTKQITTLVLGTILLTQCKKDIKVCSSYTALTGKEYRADLSAIQDIPPFLDTLAKYPQLHVYQVINDPYMYGMHCHVFYKGLQVLNHNYALFKSKSESFIYGIDTVVDTIGISVHYTITFEEAIRIAKQQMNFENTCISYQLGIYDLGDSHSPSGNRFALVWKIARELGSGHIIVDANSGQVYHKEDGIRF